MASVQKSPEVKKITVVPASNEVYLLEKRKRDQQRRKLYANVCCVMITVVIFGSSVALIAVGAVKSIEDLWILGLIIIIGGAIVLGFILGKYLYPVLVKAGARVSDKYTEEQKLHKQDVNYMEHLSSKIGNVSKKPKPTDKQLYDQTKVNKVSGAEGGGKIEIPKPPLISVPGVNGVYTTKKGLHGDDHLNNQNAPDEDIIKKPPPSSDELYGVNTNDKGRLNVSPPPPYVAYPPQIDTTSESYDTRF